MEENMTLPKPVTIEFECAGAWSFYPFEETLFS